MQAAEPDGAGVQGMLGLDWRSYRFELPRLMVTSQGALAERCGWLLRLEARDGRVGWGEALADPGAPRSAAPPPLALAGNPAAPGKLDRSEQALAGVTAAVRRLGEALAALPQQLERQSLEALLPALPASLACACGMALAELDGLGSSAGGGWLEPPAAAWLLPAGEAMLPALEQALAQARHQEGGGGHAPTVKWKVAAADDPLERRLLEALLARLPAEGRLRLDANGGWSRSTAEAWAERLAAEARLDWLEQPLDPDDSAGLERLAARLPVALDESLRRYPQLRQGGWSGWQVRRPLLEGDPRLLLAALQAAQPQLMLSTALETGIGRRLLGHLAALQVRGPTPTAPGLAPGWRPSGDLFAGDPQVVWNAAAE